MRAFNHERSIWRRELEEADVVLIFVDRFYTLANPYVNHGIGYHTSVTAG
jgi:hypothetical protein